MRIGVKDLVGENCIAMDDGLKLNKALNEALSQNQPLNVDFEGVEVVASPFLNAAFGRLLRQWKAEDLNRLLNFSHLNESSKALLKRVIDNAKAYYANEGSRKAIDAILSRYSDQ